MEDMQVASGARNFGTWDDSTGVHTTEYARQQPELTRAVEHLATACFQLSGVLADLDWDRAAGAEARRAGQRGDRRRKDRLVHRKRIAMPLEWIKALLATFEGGVTHRVELRRRPLSSPS